MSLAVDFFRPGDRAIPITDGDVRVWRWYRRMGEDIATLDRALFEHAAGCPVCQGDSHCEAFAAIDEALTELRHARGTLGWLLGDRPLPIAVALDMAEGAWSLVSVDEARS